MNNIMNTKIIILILSVVVFFAACENNVLVEPTASFTPDSLEFNAGSEITFRYSGDCDYVTFWSGEEGKVFENRHRIEVPVDSAYLQFNNYTAFGNTAQPRPISVYISKSFKGNYSELGIYDITTSWDTITPANTPNYSASLVAVPSGKINITKYKDAPFFIAFKFISDSLSGSARQVRIKDFEINAYTRAGLIKSNILSTFGFKPVNIKGPGIWTQTAVQLDIRGTPQKWEEDWFITKELVLNRVNSDKGLAIKTLADNIADFRYAYTKPGTYKARLEIINSRYGEMKVVHQDYTFIVK
jgi:hypothetical protein